MTDLIERLREAANAITEARARKASEISPYLCHLAYIVEANLDTIIAALTPPAAEGELQTNDAGLGNDWFGDQDRLRAAADRNAIDGEIVCSFNPFFAHAAPKDVPKQANTSGWDALAADTLAAFYGRSAAEGEVTQADKRAAVTAGVLLPPAANVPPEYLEGWIEGQQYLLGNWRSASDATGKWEGPTYEFGVTWGPEPAHLARAAPTVAGVGRLVKDILRGPDGEEYTDAGMEGAFFRWPIIERAINQALAAAPSAPGSGEG